MTNIFLVILFMAIGIAFLLLELFIIPGISIGGIAGFAFVAAAVGYAFATLGTTAGFVTLACGVLAMGVSIWIFMRSRTLDKMSLDAEVSGTVDAPKDTQVTVGQYGITVSRLAPIGTARFDNTTIEVKSVEGLIDPNTEVEVVAASGESISVKRKQ